ncbi:MAG: hypothetical protein ACU0CO_16750 [Shimia sp.]
MTRAPLLDWIGTAISDDAPAGPDVFADEAVEDVMLEVDDLCPGTFVEAVETPKGKSYEVAQVPEADATAQIAAIDAQLAKSRDLRLLVARVQLCAVGARLSDLATGLEAIAIALTLPSPGPHPTKAADRRRALGDLVLRQRMLDPLLYAAFDDVPMTLHDLQRARDAAEAEKFPARALPAREDSAIVGLLRKHGAVVGRAHDAAGRAIAALDGIEARLDMRTLAPLRARLAEMAALFALGLDVPDASDGRSDEDGDGADAPRGGAAEAAAPSTAPFPDAAGTGRPGGGVPPRPADRAQATALLEACIAYVRSREPSSPSLLLMRRAHDLVGKDMFAILDTLLENIDRQDVVLSVPLGRGDAVLTFGTEALRRMAQGEREAAGIDGSQPQDAPETDSAPDPDTPPAGAAPPPCRPASRAETRQALAEVIRFYQDHEPSSPLPMLLGRARDLLGEPFETVLSELIKKR